MPDPTTAIIRAANESGVLKEIYKDLAQPGVKQVGKALETVLQLGSSLMLPLRLLNETARKFEEQKFEAIAERFAKIPEESVIDISPEIGVPIMEKLSFTREKTLRDMFVELLAKAACSSTVAEAHPSFVGVISAISPDEAIFLKELRRQRYHPFVSIDLKEPKGSGKITPHEIVMLPPLGLAYPSNVPFYVSNLIGLGILESRRDVSISSPGAYDAVITYAKESFGFGDQVGFGEDVRKVEYGKHVLVVLPYGTSFINACTSA
ncbi:MAG: DUF4393 domain-containing protein [Alphaproteobacteria bacterium]|nr:MAG: DUF4393 domain-containing protein [Alphaproteobacteria bacterium]